MNKTEWLPMNDAPKDAPILAWCVHDADVYWINATHLTTYGGHAEGLSHVEDGPHVVVWGGGWDDRSYEEGSAGWMPDWWFLSGSEFEIAANPVCWYPIIEPDKPNLDKFIQSLNVEIKRVSIKVDVEHSNYFELVDVEVSDEHK